MAWLAGYTYRKKKPVNATAAGAQTLYQVKLLVGESSGASGEEIDCENHCQDFPNDIRFTGADEQTKHDYWVESITGTTPNRLATIWIEVATIPASGDVDLYMYYGKTPDSGESVGNDVFLLFDDFESYALGDFAANSKWNIYKETETSIKIGEEGCTRFGYYNGAMCASIYNIGAAIPDANDLNFEKCIENPIITPESGYTVVKDPWVIYVDGTYYLYASMCTGAIIYEIHMWSSSDGKNFTHQATCLQKGSEGSWDDNGVSFSCVFYDSDESDENKKWKMFYTGNNGSGNLEIGYAYSANGSSWTKYGSNPVVQKGNSGAWDDDSVAIPKFVKKGTDDYCLYYGGNDGSEWPGVGLVSFTDFEGTYTKESVSSPILERRHNANKQLTAQTDSGTKIVTVGDTSVFEVNEPVWLQNLSSAEEFNRVASIDSSTQLTLENNTIRAYPTNSYIRSWMYNSVVPSQIIRETAISWTMYFTAFRPFSGEIHEVTGYATSSNGTSWTIDYSNSPPIGLDFQNGEWDDRSVENMMVVDREQSSETTRVMIVSTDVGSTGRICRLASVDTFGNFIAEAKVKWAEQKNIWLDFRGQNYNMTNPNAYLGVKQADDHDIAQYNSGWTSGSQQNVSLSTSTFFKTKIIANNNNQQWLIDSLAGANLVDRTTTYSAFSSGYVGFSSYGSHSNDSHQIIDWMFVRKHASPEPTWGTSGGEESESVGGVFMGSNNGATGMLM